MKNSTILKAMAFSIAGFLSLSTFAQGPGYIIRQAGTTNLGTGGTTGAFSAATVTGKEILNPDNAGGTSQNDYATASAYSNVWTAGDDVTGSEIPYAAIPPYSSEPYADLRRGPSHLYSDFVPSGRTSDLGASYYMYYKSTAGKEALCFRLRLGSIIPGAKGYSILIDVDGKFGATGPNADPNYQPATTGVNGNSGFELEVDLFTQNAGTGIALYNVDGTSNPVPVWSASDYRQFSQVSYAGTNDNGDPDFYLDFFIPWNKITGITSLGVTTATTLRFIPTTVMSPQPAIGGPKSDIYGLDDSNFKDPNAEYELLLSAMPGFSITQLANTPAGNIPGTNNTLLCTAAPYLSSVTPGTGTATVSGTWNKLALPGAASEAKIYLYRRAGTSYTPIGSTPLPVSGPSWTVNSLSISSGDTIVAQAVAASENTCQYSNYIVATSCNSANIPPAPVLSCTSGSKGTGGTNFTAGWTIHLQNLTKGTPEETASASGTTGLFNISGSTWTYSNGCSGGSAMTVGSYKIWYTNAAGCASNPVFFCANSNSQGGMTAGTVPTISYPSGPSFTTGTAGISGTGMAGGVVSLYVNRVFVASAPANASTGAFSIPNASYPNSLKLALNDTLYLTSELNTGVQSTSKCEANSAGYKVLCYATAPVINTDNGQLKIGQPITGTSSEAAGTIIKVYNAANTLLATTAVAGNGFWTTSGATFSGGFTGTAAANTSYYATATTGTCVSANSATAATGIGATVNRCGSITTTGITSSTPSISGTLTGAATKKTIVNLYEDGYLVGTYTTTDSTNNWGPIDVSNKLYSGNGTTTGLLTIGVQDSTRQELLCAATVAVGCTGPLLPSYTQQSSNGTTGSAATVPVGGTMTYTITNLSPNTFYSIADAVTGKSYASGIWTSGSTTSASNVVLTTYPLNTSGTYNGVVKATSVSATEMCSNMGALSAFKVLPVTLVEWKGTHSGNSNVLNWETASEVNTLGFAVERSVDGSRFTEIGYVAAKGDHSRYHFTDNKLASAANYYRLRIVDKDGKYSYSKTLLLNSNGGSMVLNTVKPNPFTSEITVSLTLQVSQVINLTLVDAAGRTLVTRNLTGVQGVNNVKLDGLTGLPKGMYVVKINAGETVLQEKLIKLN